MPDRAKRHHQVPHAYLKGFGMDETVRVRWRDGKAFETSTLNVAVESGFYDVPDPAGGKSSRVEDVLAVVDGASVEVMAAVDRSGAPPREGAEERFTFAVFLALQMTRTTQHREQAMFPERVAEWAGGHEITQDLVAEYLERVHLGFPPRPREAEGAHLYVRKETARCHASLPAMLSASGLPPKSNDGPVPGPGRGRKSCTRNAWPAPG
jgi:Protein of unknown function (DUF4238)